MTDELVTRLRNLGINLADRAADRIEADAATIARLEGELGEARTAHSAEQRACLSAWGRARAAEAKVAALVEALEKLSCKCSSNCDWEHDDVCPSWTARAAIAAAKGTTEIPADAENGRATVSRIKKGDVSQSSAD